MVHPIDVGQLHHLDRPVILVADDLPPSTAVQLPLERIQGFVLEMGGPTSHTTIIARSFGIPGFRVDRRDQVDDAIQRLLNADGPIIAHVCIDPKTNVWPLVPPGETNDVMLEGMSA